MPASNVNWPLPLTRQNPWFPGQVGGVPGTSNKTGLRQHSTGAIFYVDPNHPDPHDNRDGTDPNAPLLTVAAAITKCEPYRGDVIAVMANNRNPYADTSKGNIVPIMEEVTIDVPGIKLVGVCPSGSAGVPWYNVTLGGTCITIIANDVLVEGFYFIPNPLVGAGNGIFADYDGLTHFADYTTIRNCVFDANVDVGITLEYTWYCQIYNNWFLQNAEYGIYVDPAGSGIAYGSFFENWFQDCAVAMALNGADDCYITNSIFYNSNAQGGALATNEGLDTTGGSGNTVALNIFSCLLPVPANGDFDDMNSASATDAWIANGCMDGNSVTNPT